MTSNQDNSSALSPAVARLGIPMLVFGAVFCASMLVMRVLLTPDRFPVRMDGKVVRLRDLAEERRALLEKRDRLMKERDAIEGQTPTPVLRQVQEFIAARPRIGDALARIEAVRARFAYGVDNPISILSTTASSGATVVIAGEARDPGDRALQTLASFVDGLRKDGAFEGVSEPEYVQSPFAGGTLAPFTILLTPRHGS